MRRLGMNWGLSCTGGQEMEDVVHAWAGWPNLAKKIGRHFFRPHQQMQNSQNFSEILLKFLS
jgi:hypothetical protein